MIAIARITIGEAARRRILWVLVGLAIVAVGVTGWGLDRLVSAARDSGVREPEIQVGVSQILILIAFMFSFVLAMTAAFLGAPSIASDIESGVALALLARPLRRTSYLLGRWLGLAVVLAAYGAGSAILAIVVIERPVARRDLRPRAARRHRRRQRPAAGRGEPVLRRLAARAGPPGLDRRLAGSRHGSCRRVAPVS